MFYLVELGLVKWLVSDILGQPFLFWTAVGVAVAVFILKGVFSES